MLTCFEPSDEIDEGEICVVCGAEPAALFTPDGSSIAMVCSGSSEEAKSTRYQCYRWGGYVKQSDYERFLNYRHADRHGCEYTENPNALFGSLTQRINCTKFKCKAISYAREVGMS